MTIEELVETLEEVFPHGFQFDTGDNGEVIIRTGLMEADDGELVLLDEDDEDYDDEDLEEHEVYDESEEDI